MRDQLRSELLKLRSTRTIPGLLAGALGLIAIAVVLHGYALPATELVTSEAQLSFLVGWGEVLGALFAGLLGVLSFTAEIRHGTIRPTLLVSPRRGQVMAAKAIAAALAGMAFGVVATSVAVLAGQIALVARGLESALLGGDLALMIIGGAAAAGLWALIGLGLGALVRSQVPAVVGLLVWVLFVENLLIDNAPSLGRYSPGALGQALSGLRPETLLAPTWAGLGLAACAAVAVAAGWTTTDRRDVA